MPEYDADFYGWTQEQAALLRAGRVSDADIANIAEEIETLARGEKRELVNRLAVLLQHMLEWQSQRNFRGSSWRLTIVEQRRRIRSHLKDNPSLRPKVGDAIEEAFELGMLAAERETGLDREMFPPTNPWSADEIMDEDFYPE